MRLNPQHPPGRINRKARAFEPEIARLRSEGYTCEAIRLALADIGMNVSLSTVQREAARNSKRRSWVVPKAPNPASTDRAPAIPAAPAYTSASPAKDSRTGKDIAAEFVSNRITNPLLRNRSNHESRGH